MCLVFVSDRGAPAFAKHLVVNRMHPGSGTNVVESPAKCCTHTQTSSILYFISIMVAQYCHQHDVLKVSSDFNLSDCCFGTDIIQKYTKWAQIGVHGLKIEPIFAKFQCESCLVRKKSPKRNKMIRILKYTQKP